jgi:outer membrane protein assembly factor BamB
MRLKIMRKLSVKKFSKKLLLWCILIIPFFAFTGVVSTSCLSDNHLNSESVYAEGELDDQSENDPNGLESDTNFSYLPLITTVEEEPPVVIDGDWPMLAANPERTSWSTEEVRGELNIEWYRPIEPYIHYKIQPIAANGQVYVSTARGLYAFSATDGSLSWVYPTEIPLGHSPTIATVNGKSIAFVGGYDRKIHAIDAITGDALEGYTPYEAGAGFETNP